MGKSVWIVAAACLLAASQLGCRAGGTGYDYSSPLSGSCHAGACGAGGGCGCHGHAGHPTGPRAGSSSTMTPMSYTVESATAEPTPVIETIN
jgi:hypothetical protein